MKWIISAAIIVSLTACNYDGKINGRKYKLKKECLEKYVRMERRIVGKSLVLIPHYPCKTYGRIDTIWQ